MLRSESGTDIFRAYQILFSPLGAMAPEPFSLSLVQSLDPLHVKNAFRKKALETHPDRARLLGREEEEQADLFRQVIKAYEVLLPVAGKRKNVSTSGDERPQSRQNEYRNEKDKRKGNEKAGKPPAVYYKGVMPCHPMRIGHYLYYSGAISWQSLINAVTYQMRVRPRYGMIAVNWKMISREELMVSLKERINGEKIGEYLRRLGFISDFQHLAIMGKQRKLHSLFGEYFVSQGILSQNQMDEAVEKAMLHNTSFERKRFGGRR